MEKKKSGSESGQAIVLIVLAIVALMGFLALSIDVGQAYSNRRTSQNASDASALAGAQNVSQMIKNETNLSWDCSTLISKNSSWVDAANVAIQRASDNKYKIDPTTGVMTNLGGGRVSVKYGIDSKNGIEFICDPEPHVDVHVMLTSNVQTNFMQFVKPGGLVNTVDTVVRVRPRVVYGNGASILALKTACDNTQKNGGLFFEGKVNVNVSGGDIVSNACLDKNGYSGVIKASPDDITYHTTVEGTSANVDPKPSPSGDIISIDAATLANRLSSGCQTLPNYASPSTINVKNKKVETYGPGNYSSISVDGSGELNLKPGLYCIYGDSTIKGTIKATDVTLFIPATGGNFTISAGAIATIIAPLTGCDYDAPGCKPAIGGLAILFMPDDADNKILTITGNSKSTFRGTIMAPYSIIDVAGTSDQDSIDAQLIGETIRIHGNGTLNINYKKDYELVLPTFLNLEK